MISRLRPLLLAVFFGLTFPLFAQNFPDVPRPDWFKAVPPIDANTPDWALMMYADDPNFFEVVDAYHQYFRTRPFVKTIHVQNFKYWIKQVQTFVNDDGFIRPPSPADEAKRLQALEQRKAAKSGMPGNWTCIGPFETYRSGTTETYSNQVNVYSLDQSNSHPDILYCGTESGAAYKSTDHGLTWVELTFDEVFSGGFGGLEIHPTNPNLVLLNANDRIYRTTDGGTTWSEVKNLGNDGYEIKFRPSNPDSVFCTAANGLYLSTNAGATWSSAIFSQSCYDLEWHPADPDTLYLLKNNATLKRAELFMSPNAGATWQLKDNGYYLPADPANAIDYGGKIAVSAADPNRLYVCLIGDGKAGDDGWIGVLRSNDRGENWTVPAGQYGGPYQPVNTMPWNVAAYSDGYHQGFYNFDFEVSPLNANLMWIGTIRLSESGDGGTSFIAIGAANSQRLDHLHADIQDIEVNGNEIWVANDGGIEYSTDALQTFTSRKYGISGSNYWGFGAGWNEDVLVGGRYHVGNSGYYQTYGVGNSIKFGGVEEATGYVNPLVNRRVYFGYGSTTDVGYAPDMIGGTFQYVGLLSKAPNESYSESNSSGLYSDPRYAYHYFLGEGSSIWKSTDKGITWQSLRDFGASGRTLEIEISRKNPSYIYVVFKPNGTSARQIWRTTDGGSTWSQLPNVPATNRNKLEISLNPEDENDLWVCANDAANGQKVYRLTGGGTAWQNLTTATLNGEHCADIYYAADGIAYLATNNTLFYYDLATSTWTDYGDGLPLVPRPLQIKPFFRDGKLRLATSGHGIWESPLAAIPQPVAQPITETDSIFCSRDTVLFDSYSIAGGGATYAWTFSPAPQWVSSLTARNPRVVFGENGNFTVTLAVTDGGNSDSKTIANMVKVNSFCEPDTLPGQALRAVADGDYFVSQNANLTNLTHFTVTGWWKPSSIEAFSALFSSGDWCAHCDDTEALMIDYFGSKLWYKWPGNASAWGSNSGITIPVNEWSYVALVITPTGATIYLNDKKYVDTRPLDPGNIESIHVGKGHYDRYFRGDIDEVTTWRRALTEQEIRQLRHITREDVMAGDPDLIGYWQFNELVNGSGVMDKAGSFHGNLAGGASLVTSEAPLGGGSAQLLTLASGQYSYDFPDAGLKIRMSDCEPPAGTMVATRLNLAPNLPPNALPHPNNYWIINHYATSAGFPPLDSIRLTPTDANFLPQLDDASHGVLHLRGENATGATWAQQSKGVGLTANTLDFDRKTNLGGGTQIALSDGPVYFNESDPGDVCAADSIPGKQLETTGTATSIAYSPTSPQFGAAQDFSVGIWFKTTSTTADGVFIANKDWDSGANDGWVFSITSGKIWWNVGDGVNRIDQKPAAPIINDGQWHHFAATCDRNGLSSIYLDGVFIASTSMAAIGDINNTKKLSFGAADEDDWRVAAQIEEACIYDRVLTLSEIRELMHLTRTGAGATTGLVAYFQFNGSGAKEYDRAGDFNLAMGAATSRSTSTAPVGGGVSNRQTVTAAGVFTFGTTGVKMGFPPAATYPNGELLVSRLNVPPDQLPSGKIASDKTYFVVRNYGSNANFTALDSIVFGEIPGIYAANEAAPGLFTLYKRASNAFGNTWGASLDAADLAAATGGGLGKITFSAGNGIASFSQFAVGDGRGVALAPRVILEGAFAAGQMDDSLRMAYFLPLSEPYSALGFSQFGGGGGEISPGATFATSGNDAVTDWLFAELRDKNSPANVLFTRSALLQRDGDVVDVDGASPLHFRHAAPDDYYLALRHRNHLGVMTAASMPMNATPLSLDFTSSATPTWGTNAQKDLGGGIRALFAADLDASRIVDADDRTAAWNGRNQTGYRSDDATMNGLTNAADLLLSWLNLNLLEQLP